ncbi:MAG: PAS domain-containing protein [Lentisphaeria bacterium]|nr:PAS domain-containing protein [Lentisphaeria bacterium]
MSVDRCVPHIKSMEPNMLHTVIHKLAGEKGFFENIANAISEGLLVIDKNMRILYRNNAAESMLGIPEDFSKLSVKRFLKGVDWEALIEQKGVSARHEMEILYPQRRIVRFYLVPHGKDGHFIVILTDITEEYDKTASRMENERGRVVSMLAAGVAHEIGNPLNSLYLNLQLLERMFQMDDPDLEEAKESLREARNEVERLDSIINQFLKALRPAKLRLEPTQLRNVLEETLSFMQHEIRDRKVQVICDWDDSLPLISADPAQLKQAFYNIIRNAIQAMSGGGTLTIQCCEAEENIVMRISDTGSGIEPENMAKLFQPYFSTKESGNGIGLMVVERVFREHGAKLSIESAGGKGTSFIITFPLHRMNARVLPSAGHFVAGVLPEAEHKDGQK